MMGFMERSAIKLLKKRGNTDAEIAKALSRCMEQMMLWKLPLSHLQFPMQSTQHLWNDRMGQIDISILGKLARHWGSQKTVSIISVIAGFV